MIFIFKDLLRMFVNIYVQEIVTNMVQCRRIVSIFINREFMQVFTGGRYEHHSFPSDFKDKNNYKTTMPVHIMLKTSTLHPHSRTSCRFISIILYRSLQTSAFPHADLCPQFHCLIINKWLQLLPITFQNISHLKHPADLIEFCHSKLHSEHQSKILSFFFCRQSVADF
jgi:hypothetical protein